MGIEKIDVIKEKRIIEIFVGLRTKLIITSFLFRKESYDKLDVLKYEKNIFWELTTPKYTVHKKIN